jgi:hypothetical protein
MNLSSERTQQLEESFWCLIEAQLSILSPFFFFEKNMIFIFVPFFFFTEGCSFVFFFNTTFKIFCGEI